MEAIFNFKIEDNAGSPHVLPGPIQMLDSLLCKTDFNRFLLEHRGKDMVMTLSPTAKTSEKERMYAFYHKVVLGIAVEVFTDMGWESVDKVKADYMLKAECAKGIMFNKKTGEEDIYLEDKQSMTKERLHKYISDCIHFLETEAGVRVPDGSGFRREDSEGFISI